MNGGFVFKMVGNGLDHSAFFVRINGYSERSRPFPTADVPIGCHGLPPRSKSAAANAVPADFGHRKGVVIEFAVALDNRRDG